MHNYTTLRVIVCLLAGYDIAATADRLGMAPRTVKAYLNRLYLFYKIPSNSYKRVVLAIKLARKPKNPSTSKVVLRPKQEKLLSLVTRGFTNNQIAAEVGTTENCIKNYMREIYDIVGVDSRLELALWYAYHRQSAIDCKSTCTSQ